MQVALQCIVRMDGRVPLIDSAVQVSVRPVNSTEEDCVSMMETQIVVVDFEIGMNTFPDNPLQLRKTLSERVVNEILKRISWP